MDGAANAACIEALARYLEVAPSRVALVRGPASRQKTFEINDLTLDDALARLRRHF